MRSGSEDMATLMQVPLVVLENNRAPIWAHMGPKYRILRIFELNIREITPGDIPMASYIDLAPFPPSFSPNGPFPDHFRPFLDLG